jgi:protoporphyrin/coproporphyrin ferrochelatase
MQHGVLLINLGTPKSSTYISVWRYLREFLSDYRVITLPSILRYILLYGVILPLRTHKTMHAYRKIWTENGSPLRYHSEQLKHNLQQHLGDKYKISLGMRYGQPSIEQALLELAHCTHITILPLFPHYASATSGSAIEYTLQLLAKQTIIPSFSVIREFYQHPNFIQAEANKIQPILNSHDFILFSYHGLPENHLHQSGCKQICTNNCPLPDHNNPNCYRAQCFATTTLIAKNLNLSTQQYASSFQSRLGKTPWIKPYTDTILVTLRARGIKRLAVVCPSFITDCLETLEEIGMQLQQQWLKLGGEKFTLVPGLNSECAWIDLSAIYRHNTYMNKCR